MLSIIAFAIIASIATLLILGRIAPVVGMTVIPTAGAFIAGFGPGQIGDFFDSGLESVLDVAVMLVFAILFFGIMNDIRLFNPLITFMVRVSRGNVIGVAVVTVLIGVVCHLDGSGATSYLIAIPALLPLYKRLDMSPYLLMLLLSTSMAILNMLPWGGPVGRSAAATGTDPIELWQGLIPMQIIGVVLLLGMAALLGKREQRRIVKRQHREPAVAAGIPATDTAAVDAGAGTRSPASGGETGDENENGETVDGTAASGAVVGGSATDGAVVDDSAASVDRGQRGAPHRAAEEANEQDATTGSETRSAEPAGAAASADRPHLPWFNGLLVLAVLGVLIADVLPSGMVFMLGLSAALVVNYPKVSEQMERIRAHGGGALGTGAIILAAGCFLGILDESGMLRSLASDMVAVLPMAVVPYLHLIVGVLGVPFELVLSTDAHYFALLPLVHDVTAQFGVGTLPVVFAVVIGNIIGTYISPFNASVWLGIGLAGVDMGKHIRYSFLPMWGFSLVLLLVAVLIGTVAV